MNIPGATYLWTVPSGALFSNLNSRALQVASATEAYAGEYSVRVTYGSCALDLKTTLEISACENIYIKAYNPITGTETNKLTRKPGVANKNEYEELILEVQTLDGKVIKTMDYTWEPNPNLIKSSNINEQYKAQTAKMGHYVVTVSKNTITCPLSIDIFAEPCTVVGDNFKCDSLGGKSVDAGQTDLLNLAAGDEFTTSDYTIVVTEASGSSSGWTGKGKLIFNFLKLSNNLALQIPISVTFTGIKINQCYQLYSGSVITEYDPSWGSVVSADQIKNQLTGVYTEIKDLLANAVENAALLQQKIKDLRAARADLVNAEFTLEYKTEQLAALDAAISGMVCLVGEPPTSGSRMSVTLNSSTCDAASVGVSVDAAKTAGECKNPYKGNSEVFDTNGPVVAESNSNGKYIVIKYQKGTCVGANFKYRLLSEYYDDIKSSVPINPAPFVKVMQHYAPGIGIDLPVGLGTSLKETPADVIMFYRVGKIYMSINADNNIISSENNVVWNLKNNMIHEFGHHLNALDGINDGLIEKKGSPIFHAEVCYQQITHYSFKYTDKAHQENVFNYMLGFINEQDGVQQKDKNGKYIRVTDFLPKYNQELKKYNHKIDSQGANYKLY